MTQKRRWRCRRGTNCSKWRKWKLAGSRYTSLPDCISLTYRKYNKEPKLSWTLLSIASKAIKGAGIWTLALLASGKLIPLLHHYISPLLLLLFSSLCHREEGEGEEKEEEGGNLSRDCLIFAFLPSQGNTGLKAQESPFIQIRCSLRTSQAELANSNKTARRRSGQQGRPPSAHTSQLSDELFMETVTKPNRDSSADFALRGWVYVRYSQSITSCDSSDGLLRVLRFQPGRITRSTTRWVHVMNSESATPCLSISLRPKKEQNKLGHTLKKKKVQIRELFS